MLEKIKNRMQELGISPYRLYKDTGIKRTTFYNNMSGKHDFSGQNLITIIEYLGL